MMAMRKCKAVCFLRLAWSSLRVFRVVWMMRLKRWSRAGVEGFLGGVGFERGDTTATPLGLGEEADLVLLGLTFGLVLAGVVVEKPVEIFLAFSGEEEGFSG